MPEKEDNSDQNISLVRLESSHVVEDILIHV